MPRVYYSSGSTAVVDSSSVRRCWRRAEIKFLAERFETQGRCLRPTTTLPPWPLTPRLLPLNSLNSLETNVFLAFETPEHSEVASLSLSRDIQYLKSCWDCLVILVCINSPLWHLHIQRYICRLALSRRAVSSSSQNFRILESCILQDIRYSKSH